MTNEEMSKAKEYYPRLWNKARLKQLVLAGKMTESEYQTITGERMIIS